MPVQKQLSLFLENKPGVLASICDDFKAQDINIKAITVADHADHAVVRMVVDQPKKAVHVLGGAGLLVIETDVLAVRIRDRPGALAEVARKLGRAKVNINYAYGSGGRQGAATVYLHVSDVARAQAALARR